MKTINLKTAAKLRGINPFQILLFVFLVSIIVGTGIYVVFASNNIKSTYESIKTGRLQPIASSGTKTNTIASTGSDMTKSSDSAKDPTDTPAPAQEQKMGFSFVDTSDWVTHTSRDGSFSVKYVKNYVYATCPDLGDNLMTAMAGPTQSTLDCGSFQAAVSVQPYQGRTDTSVLRTETALAQTDDEWNNDGAKPVTVVLSGGQTAYRYAFTSVILNTTYNTIEYITTVNGKRYMAVNNWQVTKNANTSIDDFDTMIQKTWTFN